MHRRVIVGNIAPRGSWGPQNMLAYIRRHGFFDADVVVVMLSSHDYADVMGFTSGLGTDPDFPIRKPRLALREIATRYLPRYLAIRHQANAPIPPPPTTAPAEVTDATMSALRQLLHEARNSSARTVILAQHWERPELGGRS